MTNPYQAPLEDNEVAPIPSKRYGPAGCGCAAIALLGFLMIAFLSLFVSVRVPMQPAGLAPAGAPVPQKTAAPPLQQRPAPVQQLQEIESVD